MAVAAVGASEPRGRAIVGRMCACVEPVAQGGGGVAVHVRTQSHRCRVAAARDGQIVRRQCCCDGSEEGGAVRCAVCAIGDLCA